MKNKKQNKKRYNLTLDSDVVKKSKKILKKSKNNLSNFVNSTLINLNHGK